MSIIKRFNESSEIKWQIEFDDFVDFIYHIYDEYDFVDINFETADGSRKFMDLSDYQKKNDVYKRFVIALGGMDVKFKITIDVKKDDFECFMDVVGYLKDDRIKSSGWEFEEMSIKNFKKLTYQRAYYIINVDYKWYDTDVHGKKRTYHITGE